MIRHYATSTLFILAVVFFMVAISATCNEKEAAASIEHVPVFVPKEFDADEEIEYLDRVNQRELERLSEEILMQLDFMEEDDQWDDSMKRNPAEIAN